MPLPLFLRTPRPEERPPLDASPASQTSSRFGALHNNVRSMINGSSVYSNSPAPSNNNTPKLPFLGFLRRPQSPPNPILIPDNNDPRTTDGLRPQYTAGSYMRTIAPLQPSQHPEAVHRHPADVPLPAATHSRNGDANTDSEDLLQELGDNPEARVRQHRQQQRRNRKHRHHRKHHRQTHWVRRKNERNICFGFVKTQAARSKLFACLMSGLFLCTVLAIYLALALTRRSLGQEMHILFIMVILAITIFFCHSLIRLFMLALHPPQETPRIPSMTGPDGFRPIRPIRVHVARDEELGEEDHHNEDDSERGIHADEDPEKKIKMKVQQPPPAYGLWRSSVRVDPNLLHWQRIDAADAAAHPISTNRTSQAPLASWSRNNSSSSLPREREEEQQQTAPRPPSYVSDDGVSYVVEAAPRSTVYGGVEGMPSSGVSDIHPAWRPGGYSLGEVRVGDGPEWPLPLRV